jgi:hypothetical protein
MRHGMPDQWTKPTMNLIGDRESELAILLLRRLTSQSIAKRMLADRADASGVKPSLAVLMKKAEGVSSAVQNALGYWEIGKAANLNARILSRYYALMHFAFAEQVASLDSDSDLATIQEHTRGGHGAASFSIKTDPGTNFPGNYSVGVLNKGHFAEYLKYLKISVPTIPRPNEEPVTSHEVLQNSVTILDLLRRVPELMPVIDDHLGSVPLVFHVFYASNSLGSELGARAGGVWVGVSKRTKGVTVEYVRNSGIPLQDIQEVPDIVAGSKETYVAGFLTPVAGSWFETLRTYSSKHAPTSYIAPVWETLNDAYVINFLLLYGLSIVVRYKPQLWYEATIGQELNQVGALLEYYVAMIDEVLPLRAFERITGHQVSIFPSGSMFAPM